MIFLISTFLVGGLITCKRIEKKSTEKQVSVESFMEETKAQRDSRMAWWREARFGLFIHWGIYAIPAGEWKGETQHGEWILQSAQIPVEEYENFAPQFNPVKFDAKEWVRIAKDAGMRYIVITSKHHDGFCLFDSKLTEYDVVDATPFKRDILKELADECHKQGISICWYHSIMDWHHPDYLPRRGWEKRSAEEADFNRYIQYMKGQVKELVTNYGEIGVLWFDGEWESTWDGEKGKDLYWFVRSLKPQIIINNRVGKGRTGMAGTYEPETAPGDFGTPEQEIPATGLGYDWETCMTMNDHWGYNKYDHNWKSTEDLLRMLIDITSKGGNFLLNVGPTSEGLFPQPCRERLAAMGKWLEIYDESIYGTTASLFERLDWGRSTTKEKKIFLHVFDWPEDSKLRVPGLLSKAKSAYLLNDPGTKLKVEYQHGSAVVFLPEKAPDPIASVIVLEFRREPEVVRSPVIHAENDIFIDTLEVTLSSNLEGVEVKYTLDGNEPAADSYLYDKPVKLKDTSTVKCQVYRKGKAISGVVQKTFHKVPPHPAKEKAGAETGLLYAYYHGQWSELPDFKALKPLESGTTERFDLSLSKRKEDFAFTFSGYLFVPKDGVYTFSLFSDDGSRLWVGDEVVVDNDGLHGLKEVVGVIALQAGLHPVFVEFFQRSGDVAFDVSYSGPGLPKQSIPSTSLFH